MAHRAYGYRHQQLRKRWDQRLATYGPTPCRRCGQPVYCDAECDLNRDGRKWQLGHGLAKALGGDGTDSAPEHTVCNERAGGQLARALAKAPASRDW